MSLQLDRALAKTGTKFRIFPQPRFLPSFRNPEVVTVSTPVKTIQEGPADGRMFVVDAINKSPYDEFSAPPYLGDRNPAVKPGPDGHFLHLDPDSREFDCATMYATVRRVLDIWEDYFGHEIPWFFEVDLPRLELIPRIDWNNAQSGYGFLEFGFGTTPAGTLDHSNPFCENFDIPAHELGHTILFSVVGVPANGVDATDYYGFQESGGDLTAIIASLHFNSVIDHLLEQTRGNLFTVNELDRVGELSASREIRVAFNSFRISDVGTEPHERSLPLTGGIFDVMVELFQKKLVARGLITQDLARRSTQGPGGSSDTVGVQREFDAAFPGHEVAFKDALLEARDVLGRLLAHTWAILDPNTLSYREVVRALLAADRELTGGDNQQTIRSCFAWRGISSPGAFAQAGTYTLEACRFAIRDAEARVLNMSAPKPARMPGQRPRAVAPKRPARPSARRSA